jgi:DNA-binding MarR family transcriptional regulator
MNQEIEKRLAQAFLEFYEKMSSWEHSVVKESGISLAQMHTIEIMGHHESLKMTELAKKMGVTTGTLTVMIDRLEENKLVIRKPHETDRRVHIMSLTEKGQKYFKKHQKLHLEFTGEITSTLSEKDALQLNDLMEKILPNF